MGLDNYTLIVVLGSMISLIAAGLFVIWLQDREKTALLLWGGGMALRVPALALMLGRGTLEPVYSITLSNMLFMLALGLSWAGARSWAEKRIDGIVVLMPVCLWVLFSLFETLYAHGPNRVLVYSVITGLFMLATAGEVLQVRGSSRTLRAVLALCLSLCAAQNLVRGLTSFGVTWEGNLIAGDPSLPITLVGMILFCFASATVVTALYWESHLQDIKHEAIRDPLTGLLNRRGFLERTAAVSRRDGDPTVLLLLDLDHFKRINDRYGHPTGDAAICHFAAFLQKNLPETAVVARIGGEEFAVFLPVVSASTGELIGRRLVERLADHPLRHEGTSLSLTVSCGLASTRRIETRLHALMKTADMALYQAKDGGRNRLCGLDHDSGGQVRASVGRENAAATLAGEPLRQGASISLVP